MNQINIFTRETEAEAKFRKFDEKNPRIYGTLVKLTRQAHDRGRRKIGIKMLIEVVRWERFLQTTDIDYRLNNNYAPRYARKIMEEYPEFEGIFNLRELRS